MSDWQGGAHTVELGSHFCCGMYCLFPRHSKGSENTIASVRRFEREAAGKRIEASVMICSAVDVGCGGAVKE